MSPVKPRRKGHHWDTRRLPHYLPASADSSLAAAPTYSTVYTCSHNARYNSGRFRSPCKKLVQNKKSADCAQAKRASGGVGLAPSGGFDAVVLELFVWSWRGVVYASGTSRTELSLYGGAVAGLLDVAVRARPPLVHALAGGRPICSFMAALRAASHIASDSQRPKANRVLAAAHVEPARSGIRDRPGSARRIRGLQHARETACECRVTCTVQ